jgi:hypothetical protein
MCRTRDRHVKRALRSYKIRNLCVRASVTGRRSRIERVPVRVVDGNRVGIRCYLEMVGRLRVAIHRVHLVGGRYRAVLVFDGASRFSAPVPRRTVGRRLPRLIRCFLYDRVLG